METETPNDAPDLDAIREDRKDFSRAMGKRITQLRRERRMSLAKLGQVLGVTQQTAFNIEIGECRLKLERLVMFAHAFGVSADVLLGIKPMPAPLVKPVEERLLRHLDVLTALSEGDRRIVLRLAETMTLRR
jgi:transcriptional regulator with XRE-family HTH domain